MLRIQHFSFSWKMDYLAGGGVYFQMKMVSCIWIAGTQLDEASISWIDKPGSPAHGHLSYRHWSKFTVVQLTRSCWVSSTYVQIAVWSFPVKNFPWFSVANIIRSKLFSLEWNLPAFCYHSLILGSLPTLPTDRRMACLLTSLLCHSSLFPCTLSSERTLLVLLAPPTFLWWVQLAA